MRTKNGKKYQQEQNSRTEKLLNVLLFFAVVYYSYYVLSFSQMGA
ncbi:hypothetical protein ACH50O_12700 [Methylomonas sp. 2BW1-5-20]